MVLKKDEFAEIKDEQDALETVTELAVEKRLAQLRGDANLRQLAGGATRFDSAVVLILSLIGLSASLALIMSEKKFYLNPDAGLVCDVNALIGCGGWIGSWQNELFFGISNSVLGFGAFSASVMLALLLLNGAQLSRFLWRFFSLVALCAIFWLFWFMYQSFWVKGVICPYCIIVWIVTIPISYILISRALQAKHFGEVGANCGRFLVRNQNASLGMIYCVIFVFGTLTLWDSIYALFF